MRKGKIMGNSIYVTQSSMPDKNEYFKEIEDLWNTHILTNMGIKHRQLEEQLKKYLHVPFISLFSNGHMALEMIIQALHLRGEVITTPFTFASTTHAIVRNGLSPVFCDVKEEDYTIDANKIEDLITERTTAIIPVHVYGHICDVENILKIANKHGLKVIYDAAHAFGETYKDIGVGNWGDASMMSFHATKVFNTIEGGAVCHNSAELDTELYKLKNFGISSETVVDGIGANAKMNEFQAAMGICNLRHIEEEISKRHCVIERYRYNLKDIAGVQLPPIQKKVKSNFAYFPVLFNENILGINRDKIYDSLRKEKIYTRKYFYPLTSKFQCYDGKFVPLKTPIALNISESVLTLPVYANLELYEVDRICDLILQLI